MKLLLLFMIVCVLGIMGATTTQTAYAATVYQYELWMICIAVSGIVAKLVCGPEPIINPLL